MSLRYDILRHAIGVHPYRGPRGVRWSKPYRNHFLPDGPDVAACEALAAAGLMSSVCRDAGRCFHVTAEGRAVALAGLLLKREWCYGAPANVDESEAKWLTRAALREAP